jgi:hypothetical protein
VLRELFGPKATKWQLRILSNEELRNSFKLPSIVRAVKSMRLPWAGHVAQKKVSCIKTFVGRTHWETFTWKTRKENNIQMDLRGWFVMMEGG